MTTTRQNVSAAHIQKVKMTKGELLEAIADAPTSTRERIEALVRTSHPGPHTVSQAQAARLLGISKTSVWRAIKRGDLATVVIGATPRVLWSSLERLCQGGHE